MVLTVVVGEGGCKKVIKGDKSGNCAAAAVAAERGDRVTK